MVGAGILLFLAIVGIINFIVNFARQGLFFIPLLFIASSSLNFIKVVQPISDVLTLIISLILTIFVLKEMKENKELI